MDKEVLKLANEYRPSMNIEVLHSWAKDMQVALKQALEQPAQPAPVQEPVAWILTDENINSIQVASVQRLIDRLKHAHHTDLCVRINGQDEWFQADWLKHMVRAAPPAAHPPQRTWVGLTDEELNYLLKAKGPWNMSYAPRIVNLARAIEQRLKEKNNG